MKSTITGLKAEFDNLISITRKLDRKVLTVFLLAAIQQTISHYYTSRSFFRLNLYQYFSDDPAGTLYEYLYWFAGDFMVLFLLSAFIIKFSFKEKLSKYGISAGNAGFGIKTAIVSAAVMAVIMWFISSLPSFSAAYPQFYPAKEKWGLFLLFESGLLLYIFAWEFIWRGFMLFGLEEKFGYYAVLIQMLPFVILHNGKPELETFGSIAGGIMLGILALRTRSILYGVIIHFGVLLSLDTFAALRFRANDYGIGIGSLLNLLSNF